MCICACVRVSLKRVLSCEEGGGGARGLPQASRCCCRCRALSSLGRALASAASAAARSSMVVVKLDSGVDWRREERGGARAAALQAGGAGGAEAAALQAGGTWPLGGEGPRGLVVLHREHQGRSELQQLWERATEGEVELLLPVGYGR